MCTDTRKQEVRTAKVFASEGNESRGEIQGREKGRKRGGADGECSKRAERDGPERKGKK
jgi:hypothetical protein